MNSDFRKFKQNQIRHEMGLFHTAVWLAHVFWVSLKLALSRECSEQPIIFVHDATEKGTGYFSDLCAELETRMSVSFH